MAQNTSTAAQGASTGFLGFWQLWRGEQPLRKAFWLYFFIGSFLASLFGLGLAAVVQYVVEQIVGGSIGRTAALLLYAPFSFLAPAAYQVFSGIGVWRSAAWNRLTGILARAFIALDFAVLPLLFGSLLYALFSGEEAALTTP